MGFLVRVLIVFSLITVTPPTQGTRWSKRFVFLVDVSGSMSGDKSLEAVKAFLEIAQQPTDDMEMDLWTFDDRPYRWSRKWVKLPDATAIEDAAKFLGQSNRWSGTQIVPALKKLPQKGQFNLVILGDGQYLQESTAEILAALKTYKDRKCVVSVVSIGEPTDQTLAIVKFCGGGLFKIAPNGSAVRGK